MRGWEKIIAAVAMLSWAAGSAAAAPADSPAPEIRAQIEAIQSTVLSTEVAGRVIELPVKEGEAVRQGALLAAIECGPQRASLAQANAEHAAAAQAAAADERLEQLGGIGAVELGEAREKAKSTQAQVDYASLNVAHCVIRAPFSGSVGVVKVRRWQSLAAGTELMELVNDRALETVMIVPSRWLVWLRIGTAFTIAVDETGATITAQVVRRGATIDPVSQTVTVYGRIVGPASNLAAGMSGLAHFPTAR
jgi:RND family efflux transporter MFP subunit